MNWEDLREAVETIDPRSELVTPVSGRPFRVETAFDDRVVVRFDDSDETRVLWREQFGVLVDRVDEEPLEIATLQPGVEPYVTVLSLDGEYAVDDGTLSRDPDAAPGESPYLVPPEEARSPPERVHDDALLVADLLDRIEADDPAALDTETLADLYVLLSDVQRGADRLRRSAREPLLDRLGPDQTLHGRFGTVRRTTRERRTPKDDDVVLDALDEYGIPHEWVLGVDPDKLDVVLAVTDLETEAVYDVEEQVYAQKTGVDESEKFSRLGGLADRIEDVAGEAGERLRRDLDDLEDRLEDALSAG